MAVRDAVVTEASQLVRIPERITENNKFKKYQRQHDYIHYKRGVEQVIKVLRKCSLRLFTLNI